MNATVTSPTAALFDLYDEERPGPPPIGALFDLIETWRASPSNGQPETLTYTLDKRGTQVMPPSIRRKSAVLYPVRVTGLPVEVVRGRYGQVLGYVLPVEQITVDE